MFRSLVLAGLLLCSLVAYAQTRPPKVLWQELAAGMTEEEVRRAAPAARPVELPTLKLDTGAEGRLRIPDVDLFGKPAEALLFFGDGKLHEVMLSRRVKHAAGEGRQHYTEALEAARAKYGQEGKTDGTRYSSRAFWATPSGPIILEGLFGGAETVINLSYYAGRDR